MMNVNINGQTKPLYMHVKIMQLTTRYISWYSVLIYDTCMLKLITVQRRYMLTKR